MARLQPTREVPTSRRGRWVWAAVIDRALRDNAAEWLNSKAGADACEKAGLSVHRVRRELRERQTART